MWLCRAKRGSGVLLEGLYESLEISPNDLSFVEAHGTGTLVGDPIEARALGGALARHREAPLPIGSAKIQCGSSGAGLWLGGCPENADCI